MDKWFLGSPPQPRPRSGVKAQELIEAEGSARKIALG